MDWLELPEFNGIALTDSYVLGWKTSGDTVTFQMDFVLCQDHPEYSLPPSSEWGCFKKGELAFVGVRSVSGLPKQESVRSNTDAAGERDYGEIESLQAVGKVFTMGVEFGQVCIEAEALSVRVPGHNNSLQARRP